LSFLTQKFIDHISRTVADKLKTPVNTDIEGVVIDKLAKIYTRLEALGSDNERIRFAVTSCYRAWLNFVQSEARRKKHETVASIRCESERISEMVSSDDETLFLQVFQ
jgi:hypothetical protein